MFRDTPIPKPRTGAFDMSHEHKFTTNIGYLVPFMWYETLPGDRWRGRTELLAKTSPMLAPLLHRLDIYTHFYYVPNRLLMNPFSNSQAGWKAFITGDKDTLYGAEELPYITIDNTTKSYFGEWMLNTYLGLPVIAGSTTVTQTVDINVLPHFAYHLIYDMEYRDENLITRVTSDTQVPGIPVTLIGGDRNSDISSICRQVLYTRSMEKDYFRGALPAAYSGSADSVELDLDLYGNFYLSTAIGSTTAVASAAIGGAGTKQIVDDIGGTPGNTYFVPHSRDDGSGSAILVNEDLRRMQAVTRWLEAENRGGTRYNEMLMGVHGVYSDNMETDYPVYLGGGKQPVNIQSIMAQTETLDPAAGTPTTVNPQGLETGRGWSSSRGGHSWKLHAKEHGIIMGIFSILPRAGYSGACIDKFWTYADREDFAVPQLQHIGDQAILQKEIGYDATGTDMDNVFGYAPRNAHLKGKRSMVSGDFLSTFDEWHMDQIGDTSGPGPDLNAAFIEARQNNVEFLRPFANQTVSDARWFIESYNDVQAIRQLVVHDIPK